MEKIKTHIKKLGNSFGIILPKKVVDTERLKEGTEITITLIPSKKMTVGDLFELAKKNELPKSEKNIKEIIKEIDKELWGE